MEKVIVIGCPGAGKSTFAKRLQKETGLPLYHLDMIWHKPDKTHISREAFDETLRTILSGDRWILDGNYGRTLEMRIKACDTVFLLDLPVETCLAGAQNRIGKKREDLPWKEDALDPEFAQWICNFQENEMPYVHSLLEKYNHKNIVIFQSHKEIDTYEIQAEQKEKRMKLYDITQELFSCRVYPTNPGPERQILRRMDDGERCNLTAFSMCAHNGTHVDAPYHFINEGKRIHQIPMDVFVGDCYVARHHGDVTAEDAKHILQKAEGLPRILIAGKVTVTAEAAEVFAASGILLLGNESQSVGPENAPLQVHKILLGKGIVLLEGIVLTEVPEGRYLLSAAPLNLADADGAPCRAWLMQQ